MHECNCVNIKNPNEHSTACLYEFALAFLNMEDSEQLRIIFWFAKGDLEFNPETDQLIIPEREIT